MQLLLLLSQHGHSVPKDTCTVLKTASKVLQQFQGREGRAGERAGDELSVESEVSHDGRVSNVPVSSVGHCVSVVPGTGESVSSSRMPVNSYAAVSGRVGCEMSDSGSVAVRRRQSSVSEEPVKRMKFHRRSCTVGFISDSQFKFLVEDEVMEALIFEENYEKHLLFHRGAMSPEVVENSKTGQSQVSIR